MSRIPDLHSEFDLPALPRRKSKYHVPKHLRARQVGFSDSVDHASSDQDDESSPARPDPEPKLSEKSPNEDIQRMPDTQNIKTVTTETHSIILEDIQLNSTKPALPKTCFSHEIDPDSSDEQLEGILRSPRESPTRISPSRFPSGRSSPTRSKPVSRRREYGNVTIGQDLDFDARSTLSIENLLTELEDFEQRSTKELQENSAISRAEDTTFSRELVYHRDVGVYCTMEINELLARFEAIHPIYNNTISAFLKQHDRLDGSCNDIVRCLELYGTYISRLVEMKKQLCIDVNGKPFTMTGVSCIDEPWTSVRAQLDQEFSLENDLKNQFNEFILQEIKKSIPPLNFNIRLLLDDIQKTEIESSKALAKLMHSREKNESLRSKHLQLISSTTEKQAPFTLASKYDSKSSNIAWPSVSAASQKTSTKLRKAMSATLSPNKKAPGTCIYEEVVDLQSQMQKALWSEVEAETELRSFFEDYESQMMSLCENLKKLTERKLQIIQELLSKFSSIYEHYSNDMLKNNATLGTLLQKIQAENAIQQDMKGYLTAFENLLDANCTVDEMISESGLADQGPVDEHGKPAGDFLDHPSFVRELWGSEGYKVAKDEATSGRDSLKLFLTLIRGLSSISRTASTQLLQLGSLKDAKLAEFSKDSAADGEKPLWSSLSSSLSMETNTESQLSKRLDVVDFTIRCSKNETKAILHVVDSVHHRTEKQLLACKDSLQNLHEKYANLLKTQRDSADRHVYTPIDELKVERNTADEELKIHEEVDRQKELLETEWELKVSTRKVSHCKHLVNACIGYSLQTFEGNFRKRMSVFYRALLDASSAFSDCMADYFGHIEELRQAAHIVELASMNDKDSIHFNDYEEAEQMIGGGLSRMKVLVWYLNQYLKIHETSVRNMKKFVLKINIFPNKSVYPSLSKCVDRFVDFLRSYLVILEDGLSRNKEVVKSLEKQRKDLKYQFKSSIKQYDSVAKKAKSAIQKHDQCVAAQNKAVRKLEELRFKEDQADWSRSMKEGLDFKTVSYSGYDLREPVEKSVTLSPKKVFHAVADKIRTFSSGPSTVASQQLEVENRTKDTERARNLMEAAIQDRESVMSVQLHGLKQLHVQRLSQISWCLNALSMNKRSWFEKLTEEIGFVGEFLRSVDIEDDILGFISSNGGPVTLGNLPPTEVWKFLTISREELPPVELDASMVRNHQGFFSQSNVMPSMSHFELDHLPSDMSLASESFR